MAQKPIQLINGLLTEVEAKTSSVGVADADKIVALNAQGKVDISMLPTGIGPDVKILPATENLNAGNYVNIYDNAGTASIRLADNSNDRPAHGFVKAAVVSGNNGTVYFEGPNDALSGLTPGARYYLGVSGAATATPPASPAAQISQFVGIAISTTEINTDIDDEVKLA